MKVFLGLVAAGLLLTACDKDKFQTKPTIEVKSFEPGIVPIGGSMQVRLQFSDKEGDVDDSVTVIRLRKNSREFEPRPFTRQFKIPAFPDKTKGELSLNLAWATFLTLQNPPLRIPGQNINEPDTLQLSFSVKDAAGNRSDTVTLSSDIVVIR